MNVKAIITTYLQEHGYDFRAMREQQKERRARLGTSCPECQKQEPKRSPTILLPGQKCYCGYRRPRKECHNEKCPRCGGKGERELIVGPHIRDGYAFPGGPLVYECKLCKGTGVVPAPWRTKREIKELDER